MSRMLWAWARLVGGVAILAVLVWRLGATAFLNGLGALSVWSLAAAVGITVVTTACSAWRWCRVARGLGLSLPLPTAVAAYYRSQFLNTALPGGVLGDVHRAARHGRDVGNVGRSARAVAWERCTGQVVQVALALVVLVVIPSPVRGSMPIVIAAIAGAGLVAAIVARAVPRGGASRGARILRTARGDIRDALLAKRAGPGIVLASVVVVAGHVATFLIAARVAGSTETLMRMVPLAILVLLAMGMPINIGGWGPREGVAAWLFGAAGLGADQGVATTTVYGVMVLASTLPGLAVLITAGIRGRDRQSVGGWKEGAAYG